MNGNLTLEDLAEFTRQETQLMQELGLIEKKQETESVSQQTINNILNYSKALSVRKSQIVGSIETVLN